MSRLAVVARDWAHVARRWVASVVDRTPIDAFASGDRTPVVLLPGIWESWRYLVPLARGLHALGHPVHPLPSLGWNGRPLEDSLARARTDLDVLDLDRPVLVAHSKGGLIGKALLVDSLATGAEDGPRGLVAVCTPFGGSNLSWRVFTRTPLGLFAPGGATVLALAAETLVNARIVSIASAWDEMIPNGSFLPGAHNMTLDLPGHFLPLVDGRLAPLVHEQVERLASG